MRKWRARLTAPTHQDREHEISVTFEVYRRNHPIPPREWVERELVMPEIIEYEMYPPQPRG